MTGGVTKRILMDLSHNEQNNLPDELKIIQVSWNCQENPRGSLMGWKR